MVEILGTHGTRLMPVGITWRASKDNITLDGCRKDTEEGVVDVFPDKTEKSGVRKGWMDAGGLNTYLTRPGARTMWEGVRPNRRTNSSDNSFHLALPSSLLGQVKTAGGSATYAWSGVGPRSANS